MAITLEGIGAYVHSDGDLSVPWPAGWQVGDIMVLHIETWGDDNANIVTPAGWTESDSVTVIASPGLDSNTTSSVFLRKAQPGDGADTIFADTGDHQMGRICALRGARETPIATQNTTSTSQGIDFDMAGVITTVDDAYVMYLATNGSYRVFAATNLGNLTDGALIYNDRTGSYRDGTVTGVAGWMPTAGDSGVVRITGQNTGVVGYKAAHVLALEPINYITINQELEWRVEDGQPDTTLLVYQSIAWGVYDARGDAEDDAIGCPLRTHRGLHDDGSTYWIPFYDKSARCSRGPLVNDKWDRYYWTQDGQNMKYATLRQLEFDTRTVGFDVGVPAPLAAPGVQPPDGTVEPIVDRAYVYTFVTQYGEEGPPSDATVKSGTDAGTWIISGMDTDYPDSTLRDRPITQKNIYRTVSVNGVAEYHYVATVPLATAEYRDSVATDTVGLNFTLESLGWYPPPDELSGLIAHPNGFFLGFVGRDIHMSVPYRPHAWNPEWVLSTLGDIVGFGIFGTSVVVCTNSHPYVLTGITPEAMVLTKHDTAEPCVARYGIVSMPFGVYYPGPNGLMLAGPRGFQNATKELMTKEEWQTRYQVTEFDAARYQQQYVAFYSKTRGLMFDPNEPLAALVDLDLTGAEAEPDQMDTVFTDEYSGRTYLLEQCNMYEWNPVAGAPLEYDWTSMEFDSPTPVNFGAARIIWYSDYTPPDEEQTQEWRDWNVARMADAPLNPLNFHALNEVRQEDPPAVPDLPEIKQPFHWSPLIWVPKVGELWPNTPFVIFELIVNETVVFTKTVTHTLPFRLPHGVKGTRFRVRLRSNIHIQSCKLAETGKELAGV